jgi:hypothetical protein
MTRTLSTAWLGLALAVASPGATQGEPAEPCSQPAASEFDFWLGEWDLQWGEDGRGKNFVTRALDGCVVVENFDGTPAIRLRGMSVSVYDAQHERWRQTWVDNQGGYLDFEGGIDGGRMVLARRATIDGQQVLQRMVWYDITDQSLNWNWERSGDDGASWTVLWEIRYTRAE